MKKLIPVFLLLIVCFSIQAQKIKHFESYLKLEDMTTRYVVVLEDNTIWWFVPDSPWKQSSTKGLPANYNIKHFAAFSKPDGTTRYEAVLGDNSIWWFAAETGDWGKVTTQGLPAGYNIKHFRAFTKEDGTRLVAVLSDNTIYWCAPEDPWKKSSLEGLPK